MSVLTTYHSPNSAVLTGGTALILRFLCRKVSVPTNLLLTFAVSPACHLLERSAFWGVADKVLAIRTTETYHLQQHEKTQNRENLDLPSGPRSSSAQTL